MEFILPIAVAVILWLLLSWTIKVFKASIKTLLAIAAIVILLQLLLGITSEQIIQESLALFQRLRQLVFNQ